MVGYLSTHICDKRMALFSSVQAVLSSRSEPQQVGRDSVSDISFGLDELRCAADPGEFLRDQLAQLGDQLAHGSQCEWTFVARKIAAPLTEFFRADEAAPFVDVLEACSRKEHVEDARETPVQNELRDWRAMFVNEAQQERAAERFAGAKFEVSLGGKFVGHDAAPFAEFAHPSTHSNPCANSCADRGAPGKPLIQLGFQKCVGRSAGGRNSASVKKFSISGKFSENRVAEKCHTMSRNWIDLLKIDGITPDVAKIRVFGIVVQPASIGEMSTRICHELD
jgi:hypothetical protein